MTCVYKEHEIKARIVQEESPFFWGWGVHFLANQLCIAGVCVPPALGMHIF